MGEALITRRSGSGGGMKFPPTVTVVKAVDTSAYNYPRIQIPDDGNYLAFLYGEGLGYFCFLSNYEVVAEHSMYTGEATSYFATNTNNGGTLTTSRYFTVFTTMSLMKVE